MEFEPLVEIVYQQYQLFKKVEELDRVQIMENIVHSEVIEKFKNIKKEFSRLEHEIQVNKLMTYLQSQFPTK